MATVNTQSFSTIVSNMVAAIQGAATTLLDFTPGSILLAVVQSVAGVVLWLQGLVLQLLTVTRLATSSGADVDSWLADFGFTRLGAIAANGPVTFSRNTPSIAAIVPVGAIVATGDGTQQYIVIVDPTNAAYSSAVNGSPIAISVSSVNATVQALTPGAGANAAGGGISVLQTGIAGVDSVSNGSAFSNGVNAETDAAVKVRFVNYLASLSKATENAILFAIASLNQNIQATIVETPLGTPQVNVTVDDGSGAISGGLVALCSVAANSVRAAGIQVGVLAASKLNASVNMTIVTAAGFTHATVVGQVALALIAYINGVGLGNPVSYGALFSVAFGIAGVTDVTNVTLNSGVADLVPTPAQTYKSLTVSVS